MRSVGRVLAGLLRALLPVLVLLLLAELGLWLAGVDGPPLGDAGLAGAELLVADPDAPDTWRTRLYNGDRPEQTIPPRDGRRRVLLFGGSNTRYFPENVLDYLLEQQSPELGGDGPAGDRWEVINLGREGYGSQRVLALLRQAMALRPDVVVIYSGHNEFVERAFALEVERERGGLGARLAPLLGALRSARVLAHALRPSRAAREGDAAPLDAPGADADPDAAEDQSADLLSSLSFADTLAYRAAYAANLAAMLDAAEAAGARVLLCTVARNMLVPPRVYRPPEALDHAGRLWLQQLRAEVLDAIPARYRARLRPYEPVWIRSWYAGHDPALEVAVPPQRALLGDAAEAPALDGNRTGSVAGAHWPDPAGWTPELVALLDTASHLWHDAPSAAERAALELARARLDEGLARLPDDALLRWDRGFVGLLLGEPDAVARMDRSMDSDHGPRTTCPAQNALVRELAAARGVPLLDADARFRARSPDGLMAFELLMDHCHLQPGARVLLMRDLAGAVAALPR